MGGLVARFVASFRTVGRVVGLTLVAILIVWAGWSVIYPERALFLARQVAWDESSVKDYEKFPERVIDNATPAFHFRQDPSPELFQTIEYRFGRRAEAGRFSRISSSPRRPHPSSSSRMTPFCMRAIFNGYSRDSIVTSFSAAKSVHLDTDRDRHR